MEQSAFSPNLAQLNIVDNGRELAPTAIYPSLPPIFALAVETLTEIFSYLPCHIPELRAEYGLHKTPRWLAVTQVCNHWRRVAHACRELWVVLPLENKHWTGLALELSRGSPLIVDMNEPEGVASYAAVSLALEHPQQICQMSWVASCTSDINQLLSDVGPAPQLESFTFSIPDGEFNDGTPDLTSILAFPALRKFLVRGGSFGNPYPLLFSPTVTELTFIDVYIGATLADLFTTLRGLRKLERLILRDCLPFAPLDNSSPPLTPIVLPHLISLSLSGEIDDVSDTLALVTAPACQELNLECTCFDFEEDAIDQYVTNMLADLRSSSVQNSYQALHIRSSSMIQTYFKATQPLIPLAGLPEQFNLMLQHEDDYSLNLGEHVYRMLPLKALQWLDIGVHLLDMTGDRIFMDCVQLHHITISDDTADAAAAIGRWHPPPPDAQHGVPRPISVVVEDVDFRESSESPLFMLRLLSDVMKCGRGRFRSVELRKCVIRPSSVKVLQDKFGADLVHWDGVGGHEG
ncbi:hypothetical protein BV25DRAFT_1995570 [Artomyces pyxidatus]|uniref:Uncharacterized protein n=1 Tax=Artomyces pyxidatus TaxID=48021 RepID=A0ACB8SLB3_9AGAM|nr:hypothetical protein BV25DRAFT_1995570 [Artomyces pyxidatus]